jgi:hypothetical protein
MRSVQRWSAGNLAPPDLRLELAAIARRRGNALLTLAERLERAPGH